MVFYLVDACSENGDPYPLIAVPKSKYTVVRYLTLPIRDQRGVVEERFVAILDIDPALSGHCYAFDDVAFPPNIDFRATPGMLEYVARYPRVYDKMMLIAVSLMPLLNTDINVAFTYQDERCCPEKFDLIALYLWPSQDFDAATTDVVCDKIFDLDRVLEAEVFPVFKTPYRDDGWVQPYPLSRP
ncbi:MAG: hypothetical protein PHR28_04400 [candidate division Zixibacteria bacterium]|jgi:hypothetical protein|nr:hypothetical protein [candidate division Zixibacteria bacterium]